MRFYSGESFVTKYRSRSSLGRLCVLGHVIKKLKDLNSSQFLFSEHMTWHPFPTTYAVRTNIFCF